GVVTGGRVCAENRRAGRLGGVSNKLSTQTRFSPANRPSWCRDNRPKCFDWHDRRPASWHRPAHRQLGEGWVSLLVEPRERLLESDNQKALALLHDAVSLGLQSSLEIGDTAGILGVEFAAGFERAPVGRDALAAGGGGFIGGVRGDPGEDAGG